MLVILIEAPCMIGMQWRKMDFLGGYVEFNERRICMMSSELTISEVSLDFGLFHQVCVLYYQAYSYRLIAFGYSGTHYSLP